MSSTALLPIDLPTKPNDRRHWAGLKGSSKALAIQLAAQQYHGLTLVVVPTTSEAITLEDEIAFFAKKQQDQDNLSNSVDQNTDTAPPEAPIIHFPDWETLPYDLFSPHQDIISQRIQTLYQLPRLTKGILIVALPTLLTRLAPKTFLTGHSLILDVGEQFDFDTARQQLNAAAYRCVDTVYEPGEYAVRGAIMDIFPMGSPQPYRIELFDDEIDTIRSFDPETQRSDAKIEQIRLLPGKEIPLDSEAIDYFKKQFKHTFDVNPRACALYQDVQDGIASAGIEYYFPLFFETTATLFDYLPKHTLLITSAALDQSTERHWADIQNRYEEYRYDATHPILPPDQLFIRSNQMFSEFKKFPRITPLDTTEETSASGTQTFMMSDAIDLKIDSQSAQPLKNFKAHLDQVREDKGRILLCAESAGRRETLMELLNKIHERPHIAPTWQTFLHDNEHRFQITVGNITQGFELDGLADEFGHLSIISETQLFGQRVVQTRRRKKDSDDYHTENIFKNLTELRIGSPVVHIDHGVGRYLGLECIAVTEQKEEFLTLEYANNTKLYVPVSNLHLIARYSGFDESSAPLHKLGTDQWQKEKRKAAEKIRDTAAELLNIYARRAARKGFQYRFDHADYELFASGFPFEETPDQKSAIEAVIGDMQSPQPMDRLICGDVGFGKTEVAMRATFIALQGQKQVAVLVPTTLLAQQHFESFKDRFADWPIQIELLSRFRTAKEQKETLDHLAQGKADIVIGTHKLIQKGIQFKSLGLVVVDEEHRFGVRHKEQLKALRAEVDILTLTATPIPRTLNMAMTGIRDVSIIATPPAKRLSIRTFVRQNNPAVIKEAILRELLRGGQVYYLHNEVKSIDKTADALRELIPEARVTVAHGQMRERELEQVMSNFYHKQFNVLVCTTIIETGIDIPTANTIIMDRADKLGLAQLHQLRGRVGRSHHQAYAYLLTPHPKAMTKDAIKRLEAITEADDLGAGFTLASHDLEIRGTGELLGDEQSGHMHSIGFTLFMEMLDNAVKAIKEGKTPNIDQPLQHGAEINLRLPSLIPDDYLPDVHNRLIMYKRIASMTDEHGLTELKVELIDRFGPLPDPIKNLFSVTQIKLYAEAMGIEKIDAGPERGRIQFGQNTHVDALKIVKLVQTQPQIYRLEGADRLKFEIPMVEHTTRLATVESLLENLSEKAILETHS